MSEILDRIVRTREEAHEAATIGYALARTVIDNGKPARVLVQEHEDDRSLQANRFYWGVVLREISEQAAIEGRRYAPEAWHELMKRTQLGYEIVKVRVAGKRKPVIYRRLRSTTKLKVKAFTAYLDRVIAFAAADLGVTFSQTLEEYR